MQMILERYENLYAQIKNTIDNVTSLQEFANLNVELPSIENNDDTPFPKLSIKECVLCPDSCNRDIKIQDVTLLSLNNNIRKLASKIEHIQEVVLSTRKVLQEQQMSQDIYFKLKYDKHDNLVCIIFDLEQFDKYKDDPYLYSMDMYLLYGPDNFYNKKSFAYLEYIHYKGALKLLEIHSYKRRYWHGKYMMDAISDLIPLFNHKIDVLNQERYQELGSLFSTWDEYMNSNNYLKPITFLAGTLKAGSNISDKELIEFYKNTDFYSNGKVYKKY
jgi:hypothetical protein